MSRSSAREDSAVNDSGSRQSDIMPEDAASASPEVSAALSFSFDCVTEKRFQSEPEASLGRRILSFTGKSFTLTRTREHSVGDTHEAEAYTPGGRFESIFNMSEDDGKHRQMRLYV